MRVFLAGATGVIGRPLVRRLLQAGHEVTAATRSEERARALRAQGAEGIALDVNDREATMRAVAAARPEVVMDQTTDLPKRPPMRLDGRFYAGMALVRAAGTPNLIDAAERAGARRHLFQSVAFAYAPGAPRAAPEDAPLFERDAPPPWDLALPLIFALERRVAGSTELEGVVQRYGFLYGPGTYYAPDGHIGELVRRRRFPLIGRGRGVWSFLHVDDAASAAVAALDGGGPGIYNVADDEPAEMREWLPELARAVGGKPPMRVPTALARAVAGGVPAFWGTAMSGASNAKARSELGWRPGRASWREGFRDQMA